MAGGFTTLPQVIMSGLGGVPVMPAGMKTIVENLRCAKSMLPGDMGGIMSQILQNGPGALLQNPIGAVMGQLQGQLGGMVSQIQGLASGNLAGLSGLLGAVTGGSGLQSALGQLSGVSSALSGLTSAAQGGFGLLDAIGHANIVGMLGEHMPAGLGIAEAMGPVLMGGQLSTMSGQVASMAAAIGSGMIDPVSAIVRVTGMTGQINGVLDAHHYAISTVQNQVMGIANAAGVVSLIASGPPEFAPIANMLIQPQHRAMLQEAMAEQIRPAPLPALNDDGDPEDWA